MESNVFQYDEIEVKNTYTGKEYTCRHLAAYDLLELLNQLGDYGWELVGEVHGKMIVKRKME